MVSSPKCLCIAEDGPAPQPWGHEPCVHLASPCSLFQATVTSPLFYHPCRVSSHILASNARTWAAVHEEEEEEGMDQAQGPQLNAQLRDKTPHGGPWPDYTPEALSIHCASLDKWLCIPTFISQCFPSPWDSEHWWLSIEHCNALTLSMNRKVHPCKSLLFFWKHEITGTNLFLNISALCLL